MVINHLSDKCLETVVNIPIPFCHYQRSWLWAIEHVPRPHQGSNRPQFRLVIKSSLRWYTASHTQVWPLQRIYTCHVWLHSPDLVNHCQKFCGIPCVKKEKRKYIGSSLKTLLEHVYLYVLSDSLDRLFKTTFVHLIDYYRLQMPQSCKVTQC